MAKPKLTEFKKFVTSLNEEELRAELHKLFQKLSQVQEFYAQELMSETERKGMLQEYKTKIYNHYWTRTGNPKNAKNMEIKRVLSDFEKISVSPYDLVDLLLYRVEIMTDYANQFGGAPEAAYNSSCTSFQKAVKLMAEHKLHAHFRDRCEKVFKANNLDWWYIDNLQETYREYFPYR